MVYKYGANVAALVNSRYKNPYTNYVFVDNEYHEDIKHSFQRMKDFLTKKKIQFEQIGDSYVLASNQRIKPDGTVTESRVKNLYEMALEPVYKCGKVHYHPTSLIGFLSTRDYTYQTCYLDETGNTNFLNDNILRDVQRALLEPQLSYSDIYKNDPTTALHVIVHCLEKSLTLGSNYQEVFGYTIPNKLINFEDPILTQLTGGEKSKEILSVIEKYPALHSFLVTHCGLQYKIDFEGEKKPLSSKAKNVKNEPYYRHIDLPSDEIRRNLDSQIEQWITSINIGRSST